MIIRYRKHIIYFILTIFLLSAPYANKVFAKEKINYTYINSISKNDYIKHVDQTNNSINVVSPNYYNISKDGTLVVTPNYDANFIKEMHNRGIKVVPFVSNHWDKVAGINALQKTETLTTKLVEVLNKHKLDGINIDVENLSNTERNEFSQFIRVLREKMPMGKELSVAVAANPKGLSKGWQGSYDYKALADSSDYLIIMSYDESYSGSMPGPVASMDFVEKSIKYAVNQGVESNKIVLGIPFYGRIWRLEDLQTMKGVVGDSIWMNKAVKLLDNYGGNYEFDTSSGSFVGKVTITENDPPFKLFSWKEALKPGTYEVWFDNDQSIQKKLDLVNKYDLKGTANWSLGQESKTIWDQYKTWLNPSVDAYKDTSNTTPLAEELNNQQDDQNDTNSDDHDFQVEHGQKLKEENDSKKKHNPEIGVIINGENFAFSDQLPIIQSGRTLVPLRGIFEALGATVQWDPNKKEITAIHGSDVIWLKANSKITKVNRETKKIEVAAQIINGRTMVPLRFIGESFGALVNWDNETKTITINK